MTLLPCGEKATLLVGHLWQKVILFSGKGFNRRNVVRFRLFQRLSNLLEGLQLIRLGSMLARDSLQVDWE